VFFSDFRSSWCSLTSIVKLYDALSTLPMTCPVLLARTVPLMSFQKSSSGFVEAPCGKSRVCSSFFGYEKRFSPLCRGSYQSTSFPEVGAKLDSITCGTMNWTNLRYFWSPLTTNACDSGARTG